MRRSYLKTSIAADVAQKTMATEAPPRPGAIIDSSDSDDDMPLANRAPINATTKPAGGPSVAPGAQNGNSANHSGQTAAQAKPAAPKTQDSESDDDLPLAARQRQVAPAAPAVKKAALDDAAELPTAPRPKPKPAAKPAPAKRELSSDSEDDVPLAQRRPQSVASGAVLEIN